MKKPGNNLLIISLILTVYFNLLPALLAGDLDPSGPPESTMKTLDEVEPRTPISSVPYIISEPGSYYLSSNAVATSNLFSGITIWADNVTIDLSGFSLVGEGTAGRHGVFIEGDHKNISIRNGTIRNWGGNGIEGATATHCRVESLQVISNKGSGINLPGNKQVVTDCIVSDNGSNASSTVSGIYVGEGSHIVGNAVNGNGESGDGDVYGIHVGSGSTVKSNTVCYNGYSADGDFVYGIHTENGCTVIGNTSTNNGDFANTVYGISLGGHNLVDQNTAFDNGFTAGSKTNLTLGVSGCAYGINCTL